jgi:hypothetical protein
MSVHEQPPRVPGRPTISPPDFSSRRQRPLFRMQAKPVAKGSAAVGAVRASTSLKSVEFEVFGKVCRELHTFVPDLPRTATHCGAHTRIYVEPKQLLDCLPFPLPETIRSTMFITNLRSLVCYVVRCKGFSSENIPRQRRRSSSLSDG